MRERELATKQWCVVGVREKGVGKVSRKLGRNQGAVRTIFAHTHAHPHALTPHANNTTKAPN